MSIILAVIAALIIAGCNEAVEQPTPAARTSPAVPEASQDTIRQVADAMGIELPESGEGNGEQVHDGTPVEVTLADPGGSGSYDFIPDEFAFSVGDKISFTLKSETEFHTFTIPALEIDEAVDGGEQQQYTFTFEEAGTYQLICVPHEALGMVGEIVVQ